MKKLMYASLITILTAFGVWTTSATKPGTAAPPAPEASFDEVLRAHGGSQAIVSVTSVKTELVRLTTTLPTQSIERHRVVSVDGPRFRCQSRDPLGLWHQTEVFDGQRGFKVVSISPDGTGKATTDVVALSDDQSSAIAFSIRTWGLLPFLQTLAGAAQKPVFEGRTKELLSQFRFESPAGPWHVYTDLARQIRKIEIGDKTYQFAGYRSVAGLDLPMIQRVWVGDRLIYELVFYHIELNPTFPDAYFSREAVVQEMAR